MKTKKKPKKLKIANDNLLTVAQCTERASHWQRCLVDKIGNLFYAYNPKGDTGNLGQASQRVLSYSLNMNKDNNRNDFLANYKKGKSFFVIYMGCLGNPGLDVIPESPDFQPFIQIYNSDMPLPIGYNNCYSLQWDTQPPFPYWLDSDNSNTAGVFPNSNLKTRVGVTSGIPVTASIADLFVSSWCKSKYNELPTLFEAAIGDTYLARVQKYIFGTDVTDKIVAAIVKGNSTQASVKVLLGVELTGGSYPFGFRPVVQVHDVLVNNAKSKSKSKSKKSKMVDPPATPLSIDEFFEFSIPCPPFCKEKD